MNYEPGEDNNILTSNESKYEYDNLKLKYLKELILTCTRNGIQLVLALSPYYNATSSENLIPYLNLLQNKVY